jgi:hypothetical protein
VIQKKEKNLPRPTTLHKGPCNKMEKQSNPSGPSPQRRNALDITAAGAATGTRRLSDGLAMSIVTDSLSLKGLLDGTPAWRLKTL